MDVKTGDATLLEACKTIHGIVGWDSDMRDSVTIDSHTTESGIQTTMRIKYADSSYMTIAMGSNGFEAPF